jgi:hypothetical protein
MLCGCRQVRSASPDLRFFGAPVSVREITFGDGLAGGELVAQVGELFDPASRAVEGRCLNSAVTHFACKLIPVGLCRDRLAAIPHIRTCRHKRNRRQLIYVGLGPITSLLLSVCWAR